MEKLRQSMQVKDLRKYSDWPRMGQNFTILEHLAISYCCVNIKGIQKVQATLKIQIN